MSKEWHGIYKHGYESAMQDCINLIQDEILNLRFQSKHAEEKVMKDLQDRVVELRDSVRDKQ